MAGRRECWHVVPREAFGRLTLRVGGLWEAQTGSPLELLVGGTTPGEMLPAFPGPLRGLCSTAGPGPSPYQDSALQWRRMSL